MNPEEKTALKQLVKQACLALVTQRLNNAAQAMQQAQDSANNEEKSSAGDKYETARAMGQADRDMNARQLAEASKDLAFLNAIDDSGLRLSVGLGSVVHVGDQLFFIALGLGTIKVKDQTVLVISHQSPLFELLKHKKAGDSVLFQGRQQLLNDVF